MSKTYKPNKRRKAKKFGFRARMAKKFGHIIKKRRQKGRKKVSA